ncbi:MAG: hypothetical protein ABFS45_13830 [Pseudomonadota bacterium]
MEYLIRYLGIGGIEESGTHRGHLESLEEHIAMIEGHGGHSLMASEVYTGSVVYECGGFVVKETSINTD